MRYWSQASWTPPKPKGTSKQTNSQSSSSSDDNIGCGTWVIIAIVFFAIVKMCSNTKKSNYSNEGNSYQSTSIYEELVEGEEVYPGAATVVEEETVVEASSFYSEEEVEDNFFGEPIEEAAYDY